jgi:hypothetical protein
MSFSASATRPAAPAGPSRQLRQASAQHYVPYSFFPSSTFVFFFTLLHYFPFLSGTHAPRPRIQQVVAAAATLSHARSALRLSGVQYFGIFVARIGLVGVRVVEAGGMLSRTINEFFVGRSIRLLCRQRPTRVCPNGCRVCRPRQCGHALARSVQIACLAPMVVAASQNQARPCAHGSRGRQRCMKKHAGIFRHSRPPGRQCALKVANVETTTAPRLRRARKNAALQSSATLNLVRRRISICLRASLARRR